MIEYKHIDQQLTGMAGEFLTVGKLFKLGLQASVTFGNAKAIDVFAFNPMNNKTFAIQVKTLRKKNCFLLKRENINPEHIFVFIFLNNFETSETFYIVKGETILKNILTFYGSSYKDPDNPSKMPAINYGSLKDYENNWGVFE
ncbi:MAG TPA: hypothetical protein PKN32_05555 [Bacteroidales bacterium]|nr:hypothetical protein [Bacteroidales bacterium]